jgi:hypothetical protein
MKPHCRLVDDRGNGVGVLLLVNRALHEAGLSKQAEEFLKRAAACSTRDQVLRLAREYVAVE